MNAVVIKAAPRPSMELCREAVQWLVDRDIEASPENLLKQSDQPSFPLHEFFRDTPAEVFREFGRYEVARRIIRSVVIKVEHGGKTLDVRAVEFVRNGSVQRWATIEQILADPSLCRGYIGEVNKLLEQAQAKLARLMKLMS